MRRFLQESAINPTRLIRYHHSIGVRSYSIALQSNISAFSHIDNELNSYFGNGFDQIIVSLNGITDNLMDLHIWLHGYGKNKGRLKAKKQRKAKKKGTKILRGKL